MHRTRRRHRIAVAIAAVAVAIPGSLLGAAAGQAAVRPASAPAPDSGWTRVWSDDFDGAAGSQVDSDWNYETGPGSSFGTGEVETMTDSTDNVTYDGTGDLLITPRRQSDGS